MIEVEGENDRDKRERMIGYMRKVVEVEQRDVVSCQIISYHITF